jgi:RNA polymerase primary sigma factor
VLAQASGNNPHFKPRVYALHTLEAFLTQPIKDFMSEIDDLDLPAQTAFKLYMSQAKKIPLLKAEEEMDLAIRSKKGGWDGKRAEEALIVANLRLVVSMAWKYVRQDLELDDLVQEGNCGLMKAIAKFDPKRGLRLSTYASWWIRMSITRYSKNNGRLIRLPVHRVTKIHDLHKAINTLKQYGPDPNIAEVAAYLNVSIKVVNQLLKESEYPLSLSAPLSGATSDAGDQEQELGENIEDESFASPYAAALESEFTANLYSAFSKLTDREADVLSLRFGLGEAEPETLESISQKYGLTRERVRQIEVAALKKLRSGESGKILRQYL